jgi:glycosyltransferase involved in cell wall biosynthesis
MKLLVISQFYPPDLGAVSFRMESLVTEMRKRGHIVYVLAASPNRYKEYNPPEKTIDTKFENRIKLKLTSRSILSRIIGFFEFYFKVLAFKKNYKYLDIDIVLSTTPYILEGLAGQKISKYLHSKHVLDVRDLWPDTPIALNKINKNGLIAKLLRIIEKKLYKNADLIIVTSLGYIDHIRRIHSRATPQIVLNGIDESFLNDLNSQKVLKSSKTEKIKILYAGNIGIAQNLLTLVNAASKMDSSKFQFILIGAGTQLKEIGVYIKKNNINNIIIIPPVNRRELLNYYLEADAFYLQLHSNEYFNKVIPSKIFEYLALNKPIIYGLEGVSKDILSSYKGTYYTQPDNVDDLISVLHKIDYNSIIRRNTNTLERKIQTNIYSNLIEELMGGE